MVCYYCQWRGRPALLSAITHRGFSSKSFFKYLFNWNEFSIGFVDVMSPLCILSCLFHCWRRRDALVFVSCGANPSRFFTKSFLSCSDLSKANYTSGFFRLCDSSVYFPDVFLSLLATTGSASDAKLRRKFIKDHHQSHLSGIDLIDAIFFSSRLLTPLHGIFFPLLVVSCFLYVSMSTLSWWVSSCTCQKSMSDLFLFFPSMVWI